MALNRDSREFIGCLLANRVEFLIIGALAVSWHGFPRYSADVDFFVRPGRENAILLVAALNQFGFAGAGISIDDLSVEDSVIQLGVAPNRIDIMTSISGVSFEDAWQTRVQGDLDGLEVEYIGRGALIRNKRASGRPKDLIDADALTRQSQGPSGE